MHLPNKAQRDTGRAKARRGNGWHTVASALVITMVTMALGCVSKPTPLQQMAEEGRYLVEHVDVTTAPEAKLEAAEELLIHANQYGRVMSQPSAPEDAVKAQLFQHQEREAAALLMRTAAEDYVKHDKVRKARVIYQSIIDTFSEEPYRRIQRSAQSALNYLDINAVR